jgi:tetratricopeptide (TPR) repeat protein
MLLAGAVLVGVTALSAQQRSFEVKIQNAQGITRNVTLYSGSYALVIGESDYTAGWTDLPGVKADVSEVKRVLENGGFSVEAELDLDSDAMSARINKFIRDHGYSQDNRLLIYFAGHGHTQKAFDGRDLGYIVPTDAPLPGKDPIEFRRRAISEDTIRNYARMIEAKHAVFIFDSCFSGKLVSRGDFKIPPLIMEDVTYPVRQFITAGAADQTVPDNSIFRKAFVRGLEGEADRNSDKFITVTELAEFLREKVITDSGRTQTPQYGKIQDIDLDRGDFVFTISKDPSSLLSAEDRAAADNLAEQAQIKFKAGELEEARDLTEKALKRNPNQPLALAFWGHLVGWFDDEEDFDKARERLAQAILIEPQNRVFVGFLSDYSDSGEERAEAIKTLDTPRNAMEFYARAIAGIWSSEGRPEDDLNAAVRSEPNFVSAIFERGLLKADGPSNPKGAFDDMTLVINKLRGDIRLKGMAYEIRGQMWEHLDKSETDKAISDLTRAIQILGDPKEDHYVIWAHAERAKIFLKQQKFSEAINDYTALINVDKSTAAFHYYDRAEAFFAKGDYQSAISDCTQAIVISSDRKNAQAPSSGFYNLRADAYEKIGRKDLVPGDRAKASELDVHFPVSWPVGGNDPGSSAVEQKLRSDHGKRSDKVLLGVGTSTGSPVPSGDVNGFAASEFTPRVTSKLQERGLTVLSRYSLNGDEKSQYSGGVYSRGDEKALRLLPVALLVEVVFDSLEDMPQFNGLFVSKVSGHIEVIDTDNNKTVTSEKFDQVRGFGNTQDQARRNALRSAAEGLSEVFLQSIKEKAK